MDAFALTGLACGILMFTAGGLVVIGRARVLTFVRKRFENVCREQRISDGEIIGKLPKMSAVMIVGIGFAAFGVAQVVFAVLSSY